MENSYGVDVEYFRRELKKLLPTLDNRTPMELHRYFTALANVAIPIRLWKDGVPPPNTVTITFTDCEVSDLFTILSRTGRRTRSSCSTYDGIQEKAYQATARALMERKNIPAEPN